MLWPNGSKTRPNISSPFGPRSSPGGVGSTNHKGTDFTGFSTVRAIADGTVAYAGFGPWSAGGNQVWIQHDGFFTRSLHFSSVSVSPGQRVSEGTAIGVMGMTGTATGVHLHLELTLGNVHSLDTGQIDPVPFITERLDDDMAISQEDINKIAAQVWARRGGPHNEMAIESLGRLVQRIGGSVDTLSLSDEVDELRVGVRDIKAKI